MQYLKKIMFLLLPVLCLIMSASLVNAKHDYTFQDQIYRNKPIAYQKIEKAIENYPESIATNVKKDIYMEYANYAKQNNPKCGYVSQYNKGYRDNNNNIIVKNKTNKTDKVKIQKAITKLNKVKVKGSAYEKAKALRNYITGIIKYSDTNNEKDESTIYSICTGKGNCQGFSLCYKYLCNRYGIPCETVHSEDHMWNVIRIKGRWYNVEPQAGHCNSISDYRTYKDNNMFLLSDAAIKKGQTENYNRVNKKSIKCSSNYKHPKMPSNVRVTVKHKKAKIKWSKGKNAAGYIFQWKYKGGKYKTIKTRKKNVTISAKPKKIIYVRLKPYEGSFYRPSFAFKTGEG